MAQPKPVRHQILPPQEWTPDRELTPDAALLKDEADKLHLEAVIESQKPDLNRVRELMAARAAMLVRAVEVEKATLKDLLMQRAGKRSIKDTKAYMLANPGASKVDWGKATGRDRRDFNRVDELKDYADRIRSMSSKEKLSKMDTV